MTLRTIYLLTIFGLTLLTGCQSAATPNTNASPAAPANAASPNPAATVARAEPTTPSEIYKAACEARKNKDVGALKSYLAPDVIEFFSEIGSDEGKTADDVLRDLVEEANQPNCEFRDEKVAGDKATLQVGDDKGSWTTVDLIKINGKWKLTIPSGEKDDAKRPR